MVKSESHYHRILNTIPAMLYDYVLNPDNSSTFIYVGPKCYDILELTENELLADADLFWALVHPDDLQRLKSEDVTANQRRDFFSSEVRIRTRSGCLKWIQISSSPNTAAPGELVIWSGFMLDITERKQVEEALRESESHYRSIVKELQERELELKKIQELSHVGSWEWDIVRDEFSGSDEAYRIFSIPLGEKLPLANLLDKIYSEDRERFQLEVMKMLAGEVPEFHFRIIDKDGKIKWIESTANAFFDTDNRPYKAMGLTKDITERKQAEEALYKSEAHIRTLVNAIPDMIWLKNENGVFLSCNSVFEKLLGAKEADIVGKTDYDFVDKELADFFRENDRRAICTGNSSSNEEWLTFADGGYHGLFETIKTPLYDKRGSLIGVLGIARDITQRKLLEEQVREAAFHDPLTHLANRNLMEDRLSQMMAASKRSGLYGAVIFLDLDNFKPLNDTYGHNVGDLLLIEVANRLLSCVREMDTVARFGGDEFVIMLSELDVDKTKSILQVEAVAEKIRIALSAPYILCIKSEEKTDATVEHSCSASMGATLFINHEVAQDEVLRQADLAMYQAKDAGRNKVYFYQEK